MSQSPEATTPPRHSELYHYSDDSVVEVFKGVGDRFSMSELAEHVGQDPTAMDIGCVYVQTVETVDGQPARRRYYFDDLAASDPQSNQAAFLDTVNLDDQGYDIIVGQAWRSPLGLTRGKVEAVSVPWTTGYDPAKAQERQAVSPMVEGRRILDLVASQRRAAQGASADQAAIARALSKIGTGLGNFTAGK